ncbi:MAG: DUF2752 domain-containing protein [Spirochaetales bacterium]|nr:DUF2752 domain-containing protein [Spirochaetales bacterium]
MKKTHRKIIIKILFLFSLTLLFYFLPMEDFANEHTICLYKLTTGHECLACGTTRAFHNILHLNFQKAVSYNRLSPFTFVGVGFALVAWIFDFNLYRFYRKMRERKKSSSST